MSLVTPNTSITCTVRTVPVREQFPSLECHRIYDTSICKLSLSSTLYCIWTMFKVFLAAFLSRPISFSHALTFVLPPREKKNHLTLSWLREVLTSWVT